jgi:hypothetical protein
LLQDRGGPAGDSEARGLADRHPRDRVVARIVERHKASRQRRTHHLQPQPAMRQRLIVVRDGRAVDART